MKAVMFYLFLIVLCLRVNAQGQEFQNFKKVESSCSCFVIPLDFEGKFEVLQQEVLEKNFYIGLFKWSKRALQSDSIMRANLKKRGINWNEPPLSDSVSLASWLLGGDISLCHKENISEPYPKEWIEAATAWAERLKERVKEIELSIYALVNNTGEVLSVYFRIFPLPGRISEKDLQEICDVVTRHPFNPDNFDFSRRDKKIMEEASEKLLDETLGGKERLALTYKAMDTKKPCVYGVLEFFTLKYVRESKVIKDLTQDIYTSAEEVG